MINLKKVKVSGLEVLPIIEGGKGINISSGLTAGAFAKAGGVGTLSGTNPDYYDENGNIIRYTYPLNSTRKERFEQLIAHSIKGGVAQAKIAHDVSCGNGRVHMNLLWEAGGTKKIMEEVLEKTKGLLHGITCGAGLPYSLSDIAEKHKVYYYPIISSVRAFRVLWQRSYNKVKDLLGGVVYEDPWLAGGHNGLSSKEDPDLLQDPYLRVKDLRSFLNEIGLKHVPIIIAGGVWCIKDWNKYLDNEEIGEVSFQFGTRPLLTKESPISDAWKQYLLQLKEGDIVLNKFSPTGFYSSAVNNDFLKELALRSQMQMPAERKEVDDFTKKVPSGNGVTFFYVKEADYTRAMSYINSGYSTLVRTPDKTVIFLTAEKAKQVKEDQVACMGCLSACRFSGWAENEQGSTGILPDARSFCIQKTLQDVSHEGSIYNNLIFAGHHAYKFAKDPLYNNGNIPTIQELVDVIMRGD